jgi:CDP-diacylglycerol--glycerol-3-phosphate 3-phosphatidyltransferase
MVRASGAEPSSYLSAPNLFSLARLPLAAAFLLLPDTATRIVIIIAAAASDYLDGWWARTRGPRTRLGALLDPVTDKIFVLVALLAFAAEGTLNLLQLLVMLFRDLFVTAGFVGLLVVRREHAVGLQARFPGKVVTSLQIAAVLILTITPALALPVVLLTAAASLWAVADYGAVGVRVLRTPRRAG